MSDSRKPIKDRQYRFVPSKCSKCGKEQKVKYDNGTPNNTVCRRCGSPLFPAGGKSIALQLKHIAIQKAVV
jgi:ribosomal protein S27E